MDIEDRLLQRSKDLIEAQLGWESSANWTNQDFQLLSERIHTATGVTLSVATLKRIWGKVKYDSKPTTTTLNTLAQFTGYENWRAFKQSNSVELRPSRDVLKNDVVEHAIVPEANHPTKRAFASRRGLIITGLVGSALLLLLFSVSNTAVRKHYSYSFSSKKILSAGVPNSVVFDYDASAPGLDSVDIQQSWDESLRKRVSAAGHQHTSIYYTPGFFHAKLVVDGEIVRSHKIFITSQDWMALVKHTPVPVYFKDTDFKGQGKLHVPIEKLKENNIALQPDVPWVSYYYVNDLGDVRTDDFEFETEVKSDYRDGASMCQLVRVLLLTDDENPFFIPLSVKGCISDLSLGFGENRIDGKQGDLSAFGVDFSDWVTLRCESHGSKGKIFINGNLVYETTIRSSARIIGFLYRFQGTGSVNAVRLTGKANQVVYEENF